MGAEGGSAVTATQAVPSDPLMAGFRDPPQRARPRTWWHWMNGNVTTEGIAADLAWMQDIGLGGVQIFDANLRTPQIVDERLVYMTPQWQKAFRFAASEANKHDLEMAIASSPGWSATGGPWVAPEDGMKKLVWSTTRLTGGVEYSGSLAPPPSETGPYLDVPLQDDMAALSSGEVRQIPKATGAIATIAVPASPAIESSPRFTDNVGQPIDGAALTDGSFATAASIPLEDDQSATVTVAYPQPVTVRSIELFVPGLARPFRAFPLEGTLDAFIDGEWREQTPLPLSGTPTVMGFDAVTARRFRIRFATNSDVPDTGGSAGAPGTRGGDVFALGDLQSFPLAEVSFSAASRLDHAREKAGFGTVPDFLSVMSDAEQPVGAAASQIIDLTDRVDENGRLHWTPPSGIDWVVYRFGWSLTGKTNHPATPEATGLEVDKYDTGAVRRYLQTYLDMYRDAVGDDLFGQAGLEALLTDSIEVGSTNWTPAMEEEFSRRRGYSLRPWLPALAGVIIGSPAKTERFLYDFRMTMAEMLAENHYGTIADVAHDNGLKVYGEALELGRPMIGDDLDMRRFADIPMAALWTWWRGDNPRWSSLGDMKGAASLAHVYGKPRVAAESMTSAAALWDFAPRDLKRIVDMEFAQGVNLPVIHTSVHVPVEDHKPGLSLLSFGQTFNRNETWADMAGPWIDYIARSAYMLQQGRNVADIALFTGDDAPLSARFYEGPPPGLPTRFAYDFVNPRMLSEAISSQDGKLVSEGGASWQVLWLGRGQRALTSRTLERLRDLAEAGVTIIGQRPRTSPSLADDEEEFARIVDEVWSYPNVVEREDAERFLENDHGLTPDFEILEGRADREILYVHRSSADADIYFINNRLNRAEPVTAAFRITGKVPELWDAITGETRALSYRTEGGRTIASLDLGPEDAKFVVFREDTRQAEQEVASHDPAEVLRIDGPWSVRFEEGRGAPAQIELARLAPLNENGRDDVKYFSGIATYNTQFSLSSDEQQGGPLWIDLGTVGEVAEVYVNGKKAGTSWFAPDRVEIGHLVHQGSNELEVRVANLWVNRLIGDQQPGAEPVAFAATQIYTADAPLRESGLIGPVRLLR
ncbi:glycoside hydrolase [Altererythrobacter endophyticus]|uniref:Glycoside hydrolase n=2 Tax=Altericroceibacterium endophyticum TaxID=1808508 RepID=A0A6I4T924_9SPHN|nr:glycoside hydrolase [Altericroceibacterium endophyticum]